MHVRSVLDVRRRRRMTRHGDAPCDDAVSGNTASARVCCLSSLCGTANSGQCGGDIVHNLDCLFRTRCSGNKFPRMCPGGKKCIARVRCGSRKGTGILFLVRSIIGSRRFGFLPHQCHGHTRHTFSGNMRYVLGARVVRGKIPAM